MRCVRHSRNRRDCCRLPARSSPITHVLLRSHPMLTAESLRRQLALQDELLTRYAERSFRAYVEQAWPVLEPTTPFLGNWHIDLIAEHLEAVTAGEMTRLLINLPPRYMK